MSNAQGIKYEDLTIEQLGEYGFRSMSEKDMKKMKEPNRRVMAEYVQPKRPKMGD